MDPFLKFLESLRAHYNRIYEAAGMEKRVPEAPSADIQCLALSDDGDDKHTLRVQGPLDPWWGGCNIPQLIVELDEAKPKHLRLLIESPGGWVAYGMALYSDLRGRMKDDGMTLECQSRGLVASAAVLPFLAADHKSRIMGDGAMLMVHNVWGGFCVGGDADQIEKEAASTVKAMRALGKNYAEVMARQVKGMTLTQATKNMSDETWYTSAEAVTAGYAARTMEPDDDDEDIDNAEQARMISQAGLAMQHFKMSLTGDNNA